MWAKTSLCFISVFPVLPRNAVLYVLEITGITGGKYLSNLGSRVDQMPHVCVQLVFPPVSHGFSARTANHKTAGEAEVKDGQSYFNTSLCITVEEVVLVPGTLLKH